MDGEVEWETEKINSGMMGLAVIFRPDPEGTLDDRPVLGSGPIKLDGSGILFRIFPLAPQSSIVSGSRRHQMKN